MEKQKENIKQEQVEKLEQDKRDAALWATEWKANKSTKRGIIIVVAIILIMVGFFSFRTIKLHSTRMTFDSENAMKEYSQGTFRSDREALIFDGNEVTHIYYLDDDINQETTRDTDRVIDWDYRHGNISFGYMSDVYVDKDGALVQDNIYKFYKEKK